ncbi:shikimate kinase [Listeria seeligeri]|uniref:shikimate kinase n=1 Tax=Listeria seeligeri TaxID=1640 RepID=UPI001624EF04|nr:AAA family ATPase [Listeria seeligeri]MBC1533776.1 DNA topology modulation protein [Listeria seeligeri]MBC1740719.1 DNA topology modulation protein [Listeria seeligeri]MBC1746389.1 DNA topology modulation protein [Listeria seeligeri]MBC1749242.1 DNA topology modulation protein [Listeria seeligeri]MBC1822079.1 DNA topology modulation protein [Listeria seeligeri]
MKIRIIGSVGSGKTTLAKKLSEMEGIPYFETDRIVWKREQIEVRRTESEKNELLKQIINQPNWIIEGVHIEPWAMDSFTQADIIIFLDLPKRQIRYQLIKRQIKQLLRIESAHYTIRLKMLKQMFYWDNLFDNKTKPIIQNKRMEELQKWLTIKKKSEIKKILQTISSRDIV